MALQFRTDPFQFTAPATNYQSSLVLKPNAAEDIDIFVRFSSGNYGRFIFGASGPREFDIHPYLNPDGLQNLEYDEAKRIEVVSTSRGGVDLLYPAPAEAQRKP